MYQVNFAMVAEIGNKIRGLRESKGISVEKFYAETGINIYRIENSKLSPTLKTVEKISRYLEIPLEDLVA